MLQLKALAVAALIIVPGSLHGFEIEGNPDRKMSVGVLYGKGDQTSEFTWGALKISDYNKVSRNHLTVDFRMPVSRLFTFSVMGGYGSSSNTFFDGSAVNYKGYDLGFGMRFYVP